ncbi:Fur family transcriptional regulator [Rhodobacter sp. TJ_12]|uniref:Fur family transcriptional regulator n=1 Tax=Rhodobacter sp. TJ_12 TaxID=2029399 RepID=UPI001CBC2E36|nr:Fur family transcriptional regulator [Rhodobacter sp. TJ_12]MBZ4021892.1 Fur family transcriptional regulator [Rhodobacter sp. TJ_12]
MTQEHPADPLCAFAQHDHAHCAGEVLARASAEAERRGLRFTPVRKRALEILLEAHRAMGAYEVLDRLAAEGFGNQPPVAYRALEFLVEAGLAHRVQRLNAFAACMHPGEAHAPVFLICRDCDTVAEAGAAPLRMALDQVAGDLGFSVERASFEALGLCPACRAKAAENTAEAQP